MIELNVLKNSISITERETIISGSVNVNYVHFHFSSHWDGLERVAVFKNPIKTINVPIVNDQCVVPWEVTTKPGLSIQMGVYGIKASEVILPTIWINLGTVIEGVFIGDAESGEHTPDVYDAILSKIQELLNEFNNLKSDVGSVSDDIPSDDEIYMIIARYLREHPPGIDQSVIETIIKNYLVKNPPSIDSSTIEQSVANYLESNPVGITEERVQEMINQSVGAAIADGY